MRKIITKAAICLTLSTICFAGENIEPDIEREIASIKITSSAISPSISADEKQEGQISQSLPMTIHDVEDAQEGKTIWDYILVLTGNFIYDYGVQTTSGLTVLGVWYRYFS